MYNGGHVWQHVGYLEAKPKDTVNGDTQYEKTLFQDIAHFFKAWNYLLCLESYSAYCSVDGKETKGEDCVPAYILDITTAYDCIYYVNDDDICEEWETFKPASVQFYYNRLNVYSDWYLKTAYPSRNKCSNSG